MTVGSASDDASVGIGSTNLYVNGSAYFNDELVVKNANVTGIVTASELIYKILMVILLSGL